MPTFINQTVPQVIPSRKKSVKTVRYSLEYENKGENVILLCKIDIIVFEAPKN